MYTHSSVYSPVLCVGVSWWSHPRLFFDCLHTHKKTKNKVDWKPLQASPVSVYSRDFFPNVESASCTVTATWVLFHDGKNLPPGQIFHTLYTRIMWWGVNIQYGSLVVCHCNLQTKIRRCFLHVWHDPLPNCQIKSANMWWHFWTQPPNFIATFISSYTVPKCGVSPPYHQARSNDQKFD